MSVAHDLLTRSSWEGTDLRSLIDQELAPYAAPHSGNVVVGPHAPPVLLRSKAALGFGLGLHELATNAAKYGALSVPGGRVTIDWREADHNGRMLALRWAESGGPPVRAPTRHGFGLSLIESSLAYELGGNVVFRFGNDGFTCDVTAPWDQVAADIQAAAPPTPAVATVAAPARTGLAGARILLVEDNALLARSFALLIGRFGATVIGPAPRLENALLLAETMQIDGAVLDIDLDGTKVWPAADILARRGIPFIFATGYNPEMVMPPHLRDRFVLNKPYSMAGMREGLRQMLGV